MGQRLRARVRVTQFFDIGSLASAAERGWAHAMKRVGATIRRTGQDTMPNRRYGKNAPVSLPGEFPQRHSTTNNSLRNIQFDYDPRKKSVVVGPVRFKSDTARLIEFGGVVTKKRTEKKKKARRMHYAARPFMKPSFEKEKPFIAGHFKNVFTD